jgi:formylglycine-generating enzyme required for sulfatase activity
MVFIPAGTFMMGSPSGTIGDAKEERQHRVTLRRAFYMGRTEVTQGAWKALSGGINPACFQSPTGVDCRAGNANDSGPVERLDWYSAVGFANAMSAAEGLPLCYSLSGCTDPSNGWQDGIHSGCDGALFEGLACAGYRLPTESEWEYAARAGTTTATYAGDIVAPACPSVLTGARGFPAGTTLEALGWYGCNAGAADGPPPIAPGGENPGAQGKPPRARVGHNDRTHVVGGKAANQWGLLDMLGNVEEWTGDWHGPYPATVTDPSGATTGSERVFRGGSWMNQPSNVRAASRRSYTAGLRNNYLGFRLARTAPQVGVR